MQLSLILR